MDYLGGILSKALGLTPVAERRRPSRFEPLANNVASGDDGSEQNVETESPRLSPAPQASLNLNDRNSEPSLPFEPPGPMPRAPKGPRVDDVSSPTVRGPTRSSDLDQVGAPPRAEAPIREVPAKTPPPVEPPKELKPSATPRVERVETVARKRIHREDHVRTEVTSNRVVETHHWRQPSQVVPKREAVAPLTKSEAPEVHVSIGRIEVRATFTPPVTTPAGRPKAPQLGLDAYLKSRSGGKS